MCMCWSAFVTAAHKNKTSDVFFFFSSHFVLILTGKYTSHIKCFHIAGKLSLSELSG